MGKMKEQLLNEQDEELLAAIDRPPYHLQIPSNPKQLYGDKKVGVQFVPPVAFAYLGLAMKEGARKYGPFNWRDSNVESMTYVGAAMRHIMAYADGEDIDPESGNPHLAHAMACMAILADAHEGLFINDNRPKAGPAPDFMRKITNE